MRQVGSGDRLTAGLLAGLLCVGLAGCGQGGAIVSSAVPAAAVPGAPAGPVLGYAWSAKDETLRPLLGVIGSSTVGQSIVAAGAYVAGAASSASDLGIVEDVTGSVYLLALPGSAPTRLAGGAPDHAVIAMAPQGGAAIAYAPGGSSVMVLTNLAGTVKVTTLGTPAGATITAAVVSDAGTVLVETGGGAVGVLSAAGALGKVTTVAQVGGMSFLPGIEDALVADGGKSTVTLVHSVAGSPTVQALSATGVNQPAAVSVSRDGRWGVVANGGEQSVVYLDLQNGGAPVKMACACQPTVVNALNGGKAFRLNDVSTGPVWMVDLSGTSPRMLFVPAIQ